MFPVETEVKLFNFKLDMRDANVLLPLTNSSVGAVPVTRRDAAMALGLSTIAVFNVMLPAVIAPPLFEATKKVYLQPYYR